VYKLVNAAARFSRYREHFALAQPAYDFALLVADYTSAAFEEETSDAKLRRLMTAKRALAECMCCLWLAEEEGYETLKLRIAAELVRIHLESYIKTLIR
jgi:hypothetical protein